MCRVHAFQEDVSSKCINSLLLLLCTWTDPGFLERGFNLQRGFNLLNLPDNNLIIFPDFSENSLCLAKPPLDLQLRCSRSLIFFIQQV